MSKPIILCVDDEEIVLSSLKLLLREHFKGTFDLEFAQGGEEALEIVQEIVQEGKELSVAVVDYIMPEMKGDEVLAAIHSLSPDTRTIMLTGQSSLQGITNAINKANLYRFIAKPWEPDDFILTLKEAVKSLDQQRQISLQNQELKALNASLEVKIAERTESLRHALFMFEAKNKAVMSSINYALRLQSAMLPMHEEISRLLPQHFVLYSPRDIVSGDLYFLTEVDGLVFVAAIDCTGHGVPGAFMSIISNRLLTEVIVYMKLKDPAEILMALDTLIRKTLKQDQTGEQDGFDIGICVIDKAKGVLHYSGAMIKLYYSSQGHIEELAASRRCVGGTRYIHEANFSTYELPLASGTTYYMASDGYQDQFGGVNKTKFYSKRLKALLESVCHLGMSEQHEVLLNNLQDWMDAGKETQTDDVLLIGFRVS